MKALITCCLIILPSIVLSQEGYHTGYIVDVAGDTIAGLIKDRKPGSTERLKKIRLISDNGQSKRYSIHELKGYRIMDEVYEVLWVNEIMQGLKTNYVLKKGSGEKRYLKILSSGKLIHYQEELIEQGSEFTQSIDFLRRPGEGHMVRATQGILGLKKKRLTEYFNDCPELTIRINNAQINSVNEILDFYSASCH